MRSTVGILAVHGAEDVKYQQGIIWHKLIGQWLSHQAGLSPSPTVNNL
jgi:hypothetical protein